MTIAEALPFLHADRPAGKEREIAPHRTQGDRFAPEISHRCGPRLYLPGPPSGDPFVGESQRIRLATQIGSGLTGVLYVLDEPSIGLHQRDNERLLATLKHLRDLGNTVVVVEHDYDTILRADYVIDLGPGAGRERGLSRLRGHAGGAEEG